MAAELMKWFALWNLGVCIAVAFGVFAVPVWLWRWWRWRRGEWV